MILFFHNSNGMYNMTNANTQQYNGMKFVHSVARFVFVYSAFAFIHAITTNIYVEICANPSLKGIILSVFHVPAPHCAALRTLMDFGVNGIYSMWSVVFIWLANELSKFIPKR